MSNFKHIFAIIGGFTGLLVSGAFFWDGKGNKVSYISIGIAIGVMVGYFVAALLIEYKNQGYVLVKKMQKLNPIKGKPISEVIENIGGYTSKRPVRITDRDDEIGQIYKFVDGKYDVEIMVGADEICIGIYSEILNGKKIH